MATAGAVKERRRCREKLDIPDWIEETYRLCFGCGFRFAGEEVNPVYGLCSNCRPAVTGAVTLAVRLRQGAELDTLPRCLTRVDHSGRVGR